MAVDEKVQGALFSDATLVLGEIHWAVLKAARAMDRERWDKVKREFGSQYEDTAFGKEVGMDEIHWWIFEKEPDVDVADNGEPGVNVDTFAITLSNGYSASGKLGGGNIQLHMPCR